MGLALFIISCLIGAAGLVGIIKGNQPDRVGRYDTTPGIPFRKIGAVAVAIALLIIGLSSLTKIPSRNLACVTSLGQLQDGTLDAGWHLIQPWASTEDYDGTLQTLKLTGASDDNGDPIQVRLANSTMATVDVSLQWHLDEKADISQLCRDYKTFDKVDQNVVRRNLSAALAVVFENYDPLAALEGKKVDGISTLSPAVKTELAKRLPAGIEVTGDIALPKIVYADKVQEALDKFNSSVADTKVAEQQKQTALAQAEAAKNLASQYLTPEVLYQNCLSLTERLASAGHIWAGWSCGTPPGLILQAKS